MFLPEITKAPNLKGKRILLRLTLNVPIKNRVIKNDFRLKRILPTLKFLRDAGAKTLVISHIGKDGSQLLRRVVRHLNKYLEVGYLPDTDKARLKSILKTQREGSVFVLENIRRYPEEFENDLDFAKDLASYGDIYVNEDFAVSHRKHASITGLPRFLPSYIGPLFNEEVQELSKIFKPKHPFVVIFGGAKFKAKLPLIKLFLESADKIIVVGALANAFFKAKGYEVGKSLVDDSIKGLATLARNKKLILPSDVVVRNQSGIFTKNPNKIAKQDNITDIGPATLQEIKDTIQGAKLILWNGPAGKYERGFNEPTESIARAIARSGAYSIVGGGDTISSIAKLGILKKFNFVSTGGGAMLDFLANGTLPGIEAIEKSRVKKRS